MVDVLDERLDAFADSPFLRIFASALRRANSSRVRASRKTATNGPLPEENCVCGLSFLPAARRDIQAYEGLPARARR